MIRIKKVLNNYMYKYRYIDKVNTWGYIYSTKDKQYFIDDNNTYIYEYNN